MSVRISEKPVSVDSVMKSVRSKHAGCTVTFTGTVRDESEGLKVSRMELETAKGLALKDLRRIADEAVREFKTTNISVVHRVGKLRVGDTIVAICVSAPHRREAFAACRYVIDELKKTTPIWKKESDGKHERWVEGKG